MEKYKIVVLGASGSGKTVFLASLYKQLSMQKEDFGFYLDIDSQQGRELVAKYRQIANPEQEWPASTDHRHNKSWSFACCVQDDRLQIHQVMHFEYLDYAGEALTDSLNENEHLEKAFQEADVLLCLLDGQKVQALMQGEKMGQDLLNLDLPNILPYLQRAGDKPVHFVLTKWDLFLTDEQRADEHHVSQSERDLLRSIRDFLLKRDPNLRNFVHRRARQMPVRLIPISAVGKNFARLEGQQMKKVGNDPQPLHVEMPLICVLFDVFKAHLDRVREQVEQMQNDPVEGGALQSFGFLLVGWFFRVSGRVALLFGTHGSGGLVPDLGGVAIDSVVDRLGRKVEERKGLRLQELKKQKEEAIEAIQDQESALEYTLDCFHFLFRKLQQEFPSSDFDKA